MISRNSAFSILADCITDELVVTGIASQTTSWFDAKDRPENLYLRGPMGLGPAVGLGVALAHPDRKVVVLEGDGSILMGLSALTAVSNCLPPNYMLICLDNQIYEAGGKGPTINAGRVDFVKTVQGLGINLACSASEEENFKAKAKEHLATWECSFLHVNIDKREGLLKPPMLKPYEMKQRFLANFK